MDQPYILAVVLVIAAAVIIGKLLKAPIKLAFKLLLNALSGLVTLMIINFLGAYIGLEIAISWLSCIIAGIFGIPGVIFLFVLQWAGLI